MEKEVKKENKNLPLFIIIGAVALVAIIFLIVNRTQTVTCTIHNDQSASNYKIDTTYLIKARRGSVYNIKIDEVVVSKNTTILSFFEKKLSEKYDKDMYKVNTNSANEKVTISSSINLNKGNVEKFVSENEAIKEKVKKSNALSLENAKALYESLGATCK